MSELLEVDEAVAGLLEDPDQTVRDNAAESILREIWNREGYGSTKLLNARTFTLAIEDFALRQRFQLESAVDRHLISSPTVVSWVDNHRNDVQNSVMSLYREAARTPGAQVSTTLCLFPDP